MVGPPPETLRPGANNALLGKIAVVHTPNIFGQNAPVSLFLDLERSARLFARRPVDRASEIHLPADGPDWGLRFAVTFLLPK